MIIRRQRARAAMLVDFAAAGKLACQTTLQSKFAIEIFEQACVALCPTV
jgi:hypothetical protein